MLTIAAFAFLHASTQPDFVQPIQRAPILMVHADLGGHDVLLGIDTGSFDFILKPGAGENPTLKFLSPDPLTTKTANFPSPADGIVGLNYLHDKAIGIDVHNGAMSVWTGGNLTPDQINFWFSHNPGPSAGIDSWTSVAALPYTTVDLQGGSGDGHFLVGGTIGTSPVQLGLDTGAALSGLDESVAPTNSFVPLFQTSFGGLQQNWPVHVGILDSLSLGGQEIQAHAFAAAPKGSLGPAQGLLGFDMFENRRAIIDLAAHKLYLGALDPTPIGIEALEPIGINLAPFVGGKQFIGVIPDSSAAKAGLKSGDELMSIDDQPVAAANARETGSSLPIDYSKSGIPKTLKIVAQSPTGETKTVTVTSS
jgi:hypothetical protein